MQQADLNSSNWKPVDLRDRLATVSLSSKGTGLRLVSSTCHREAGRSHSGGAAAQAMNLCAAQPNNQACVALVVVANGRWRGRYEEAIKNEIWCVRRA